LNNKKMNIEYIKQKLGTDISDIRAAKLKEPFMGLNYVISICIKLSDSVINTIEDKPTITYFHHYRCVNRALDDATQKIGQLLQSENYDFFPIAASQSDNTDGKEFCGIFSHKQAAVMCGMGFIGVNNLFIHEKFGTRVRLATIFTDCPITENEALILTKDEYMKCSECGKCIKACPAHAITKDGFDPRACSQYMKNKFQLIGRGSVCGICMSVCDYHHCK